MSRIEHYDVCVVGAGPAGCSLAIRLARLGHRVALLDRAPSPLRRIGESLNPDVWPQLDLAGAREAIASAGFPETRRVLVQWETPEPVSRDSAGQAPILVDRRVFDARLRNLARASGVRCLRPASVKTRIRTASGWQLAVATLDGAVLLEATHVAEAGGRAAAKRRARKPTAPQTVALYTSVGGAGLPDVSIIESGSDQWYWGMQIPGGSYGVTVITDYADLRQRFRGPIGTAFGSLLRDSKLLAPLLVQRTIGRVGICDATPFFVRDCVGPGWISVGEAALALDPLSSAGVSRAIQNANTAAVALHTSLLHGDRVDAAAQFYRDQVTGAAEHHAGIAAQHYRAVAARIGTPFWMERGIAPAPRRRTAFSEARLDLGMPVALAADALLQQTPCMIGDFIEMRIAVHHPNLERAVAFLGNVEIAELLYGLPHGTVLADVLTRWSERISSTTALDVLRWLMQRKILVMANEAGQRP